MRSQNIIIIYNVNKRCAVLCTLVNETGVEYCDFCFDSHINALIKIK